MSAVRGLMVALGLALATATAAMAEENEVAKIMVEAARALFTDTARTVGRVPVQQVERLDESLPGLVEALARTTAAAETIGDAERRAAELAQPVADALARHGIDLDTALAPHTSKKPMLLSHDAALFSDQAAATLALGGAATYKPGMGAALPLVEAPDTDVVRDDLETVGEVLAAALARVREGTVTEADFEAALRNAIARTEPDPKRGLEKVAVDPETDTAIFTFTLAGASLSAVRVDLETFAPRLKGLLVFAPLGEDGEMVLVDPWDESEAAQTAREMKRAELISGCDRGDNVNRLSERRLPQCGRGLGPGMLATVNRGVLLARVGLAEPAPQEDAQ